MGLRSFLANLFSGCEEVYPPMYPKDKYQAAPVRNALGDIEYYEFVPKQPVGTQAGGATTSGQVVTGATSLPSARRVPMPSRPDGGFAPKLPVEARADVVSAGGRVEGSAISVPGSPEMTCFADPVGRPDGMAMPVGPNSGITRFSDNQGRTVGYAMPDVLGGGQVYCDNQGHVVAHSMQGPLGTELHDNTGQVVDRSLTTPGWSAPAQPFNPFGYQGHQGHHGNGSGNGGGNGWGR